MPTPTALQAELDRHRALNQEKLTSASGEPYNADVTGAFLLRFRAATRADAETLGHLLFAKGMRLLPPDPEQIVPDRFEVNVVARHSAREITTDDFVCDLLTLASGVHGTYEGWELLASDASDDNSAQPAMPSLRD